MGPSEATYDGHWCQLEGTGIYWVVKWDVARKVCFFIHGGPNVPQVTQVTATTGWGVDYAGAFPYGPNGCTFGACLGPPGVVRAATVSGCIQAVAPATLDLNVALSFRDDASTLTERLEAVDLRVP